MKIQLIGLRTEQTVAFREEMQEAFQHGFQSYYKDDNQMTNEREQSQACMNGRVAKDEDEVKWGRME